MRRLDSLHSLRVAVVLPWPLNAIIPNEALADYNRILIFLLTARLLLRFVLRT